MSNDFRLNGCPFCGEEVKIVDSAPTQFVCTGCSALVYFCICSTTNHAVRLFNKRAKDYKSNLIWKSIPGFPHYEISEYGDVKRVAADNGTWNHRIGETITPSMKDSKNQYLVLKLYRNTTGSKLMSVHNLVALTFHGPKPSENHCALHRDDNKLNNHYTNIYWGTRKQNAIDRNKNGKGRNLFTEDQIREIKELSKSGMYQKDIAAKFSVAIGTISAIVCGRNYSWVK